MQPAGFDELLEVYEDGDLWPRLALVGPFALLRRRTVVHGRSTDSLLEHGRRSGAYLRAMETSAARTLGAIEVAPPEQRWLEAPAAAVVRLLQGIGWLRRGEPTQARSALVEACRRWPDLSREAEAVVERVRHVAAGRRALAGTLQALAELWPEPWADTPLYMRAYAAALTLRGGEGRAALAILDWHGLLRNPGVAVRTAPVAERRLRRRLDELAERRAAARHGASRP